jgi:hypothetical protein
VHQQDVLGAPVNWQARLHMTAASDPDYVNLAAGGADAFVHQPSATRTGEGSTDDVEIRLAPVVVIARHAIQRRLDSSEAFQGLTQKPFLFDNIAGETDEVRRERIDLGDHRLEVSLVPFVMHVSEMDKAMYGFPLRQAHTANYDPARFKPKRVRNC